LLHWRNLNKPNFTCFFPVGVYTKTKVLVAEFTCAWATAVVVSRLYQVVSMCLHPLTDKTAVYTPWPVRPWSCRSSVLNETLYVQRPKVSHLSTNHLHCWWACNLNHLLHGPSRLAFSTCYVLPSAIKQFPRTFNNNIFPGPMIHRLWKSLSSTHH